MVMRVYHYLVGALLELPSSSPGILEERGKSRRKRETREAGN